MITAHRFPRVFKPGFGLILAGLFVVHLAYADTTDPTATSSIVTLDSVATQTTDPAVTMDVATPVSSDGIVSAPLSDAAPFDPFVNSEQPVVIDPALIPPPAE